MAQHYPDAHCALVHRNAFELLVAVVLSAQTTDVGVNKVTPELFRRYPGPAELAAALLEDLEGLLRSIGLYKTKAKNIKALSTQLLELYGGRVPRTSAELTELPGVGRKTANVVLGDAFGLAQGVVVDTHVARLSFRLGWTDSENPVKIETELQEKTPKDRWVKLSHELIYHGRQVCKARNPACDFCFLLDLCPQRGVDLI